MWEHHEVCEGNPAWAEAVAKARAAGRHALADRLLDPAEYPDGKIANAWSRSVQWNLERTDRDNFGPRLDVRHTGQISLIAGLEHASEAERRMLDRREAERVEAKLIGPAHDSTSCDFDGQEADQRRVEVDADAGETRDEPAPPPARRARKKK